MPGASPGARIQRGVGTSRRTRRWPVCRFGAAYMCRVATVVCSANSNSLEVCSTASWSMAVRVPSRSAASRIRWIVGVRYPTMLNRAWRGRASFTGRPTTRAPIAASTALGRAVPLDPKPPPTCSVIT
jgi:hypothetical protein